MGAFGWPWRRGSARAEPWQVVRDGDRVRVSRGRDAGEVTLAGARAVRVIPLGGANPHGGGQGWQVAVAKDDGDVPLGRPQADWREAVALARQVMAAAGLPLDDWSERLIGGAEGARHDVAR
jgi:hypothetical protein